MPTPAEELRATAQKLLEHADAAEAKRPGPWSAGAAGSVISPRDGGVDYVTGHTIPDGPEIARYIALMDPNVGRALADWLDSEAARLTAAVHPDRHETYGAAALAVARALNGDR
ncbi:hypothetical protein ACFUGD_02740 [Streptomyces sp. NPDC057217]|uniref:hypothetical protein n=1 Tax=Streptomyces sp. NPDC057217 TaxID=3346054 RepID=UPI0036286079